MQTYFAVQAEVEVIVEYDVCEGSNELTLLLYCSETCWAVM